MVPPFELREAEKTFSQLSGKLDTLLGTVPMLSSRDREQLIVFLVQELQQVYSAIKKSTKSQQPSALRDLLSHPPQLVQKHLTRLEVRLLGPPVILPERFRSVEANCIGSGHNPSLLEGPFSPVNLANGSAKRAFEEAISADVVVRMLAREEGRLRRALGPQGLAFAVVGEWFGESAKRVENICDLYRKKQKHRDSQRK